MPAFPITFRFFALEANRFSELADADATNKAKNSDWRLDSWTRA
jgi:hypothetical protein